MPSGRLVCRCHDVFLWCYVCFVLLRFRLHALVEAAALRSIVLRYAGARIATCVSFSFIGDVAFSEYFWYHFRFLFVWRVLLPSYVLSFRMVFFYRVTTGWIFDTSLGDNLINKNKIKIISYLIQVSNSSPLLVSAYWTSYLVSRPSEQQQTRGTTSYVQIVTQQVCK